MSNSTQQKSSRKGQKGFTKGVSGNPGGMAKGTKQKATLVREAFLDAFEKTGGIEAFCEWVKSKESNRKEFYKMVIAILPKEIEMGGAQISNVVVFRSPQDDQIKQQTGSVHIQR